MDNDQVIRELRLLYPKQPISLFMQILQRVGLENHERLREELGAVEHQTLHWLERQQKKKCKRAKAGISAYRKLEIHRALRVDICLPVPVEYAQLVLVYGFARFGSRVIFAERHKLKADSVKQNVARKLEQVGIRLDRDAINKTLAFLISQGVVVSDSGKDGALSLNLDERGSRVTADGRIIVKEVKRFFHGLFKK